MKVKNDHRSNFPNLSNWKEEAWKKSGLQRDSNPVGAFFFRLFLSNCLNWKIYCDDHSSLSKDRLSATDRPILDRSTIGARSTVDRYSIDIGDLYSMDSPPILAL